MDGKSPGLSWTTHVSPESMTVVLSGEFDLGAAAAARQELMPVFAGAERRVGLDLSALEFIDSSGIAFLLDAKRNMDARDVPLVIESMSPIVARVLDVTGLGSWFNEDQGVPLATVTDIADRRATG